MSWQQLCCGKQNGYADHIGKVCFQQYGPRQGTRKATQSSNKTDREVNFIRWQRENVEYFFMSWQQLCCGKQNGYADHIGKVCFQQYGPRQGTRKAMAKLIEKSTSSDDRWQRENVEYFFMSWQQLGKQNGYADHAMCVFSNRVLRKEQEKLHNHQTKLIENSTSSDDREKTWNISSCLDSSFVVANRMDMLTT